MDELKTAGKVATKSQLSQLLEAQGRTSELLEMLGSRLSPVTSHQPGDTAKAYEESDYHINAAVQSQHVINDAISYLIETVVV